MPHESRVCECGVEFVQISSRHIRCAEHQSMAIVSCTGCGAKFWRTQGKPGRPYCSQKCSAVNRHRVKKRAELAQ